MAVAIHLSGRPTARGARMGAAHTDAAIFDTAPVTVLW